MRRASSPSRTKACLRPPSFPPSSSEAQSPPGFVLQTPPRPSAADAPASTPTPPGPDGFRHRNRRPTTAPPCGRTLTNACCCFQRARVCGQGGPRLASALARLRNCPARCCRSVLLGQPLHASCRSGGRCRRPVKLPICVFSRSACGQGGLPCIFQTDSDFRGGDDSRPSSCVVCGWVLIPACSLGVIHLGPASLPPSLR